MLSDESINAALAAGDLEFFPALPASAIQPASVDLRLGKEFATFYGNAFHSHSLQAELMDMKRGSPKPPMDVQRNCSQFVLLPLSFALATTEEYIRLPPWLAARVEGKSTLGRCGLAVHVTAGFIDPGFQGSITLELFNCTNKRMVLHPGMDICQVAFTRVEGKVGRPYGSGGLGSHYQGQVGVTLPR